ncbi:Magnesium transport protein CorA [Phycisphaerae bacterium RAS1]|nr:Magnesium transport protein CorA [Phycisphaerae bacterium RAS1]
MSKSRRRRRRAADFHRRTLPGAPPGILVPDLGAAPSDVRVLAYGPDGHIEEPLRRIDDIPKYLAEWPVTWINVDGVGDTTVVSQLGKYFGFHPLALEDVVHVHQRAKTEQYGQHLFVVARMPQPGAGWQTEQISLFVGQRFVVSFQERPGGDCLDPVRIRIRTGVSRLRCAGSDYLLYSILDAMIDNYFPLIEECGDRLDAIEGELLSERCRDVMPLLQDIKHDLLSVRRAMWPLRDALNALLRDGTTLIAPDTRIYLRDCHDHTIQIVDLLESYRDITSGLTDVYLSTVSQRTNEIMKVLTIISTIFIPLSFVAGVWGMNFDPDSSPWNMPELRAWWGYPAALTLMTLMSGGLLAYFWRKGWFARSRRGGSASHET